MADTQRDDLQADPGAETRGSSAADTAAADTAVDAAGPTPGGDLSSGLGQGSAPPEPAPQPATAPATEPSVETSTTVPPLGGSPAGGTAPAGGSDGEGGEWALLVEKLQAWWSSGELQKLWQQSRTPLTVGLALIAVLLVLQVYAGLLGAINSLPLVPGLLELVGLIWAVRQGLPKLIRRSEREQLLDGLQQRWSSFRGKR